jgi:hypothetical protein
VGRSGTTSATDRFLGVRLSPEEVAVLDRFQQAENLATRSDAVRALLRATDRVSSRLPDLPVLLQVELENLVENGIASDMGAALQLVVTLGFGELTKVHVDGAKNLATTAREQVEDRENKRRAAHKGRELLDK